jgi:hypothetical protein
MIGLQLVVTMEDKSEEESEHEEAWFTGEEFGDGKRNNKKMDKGEEGSESEDNMVDSGEDDSSSITVA